MLKTRRELLILGTALIGLGAAGCDSPELHTDATQSAPLEVPEGMKTTVLLAAGMH